MRNFADTIKGFSALCFLIVLTVGFVARWVIEGAFMGALTWSIFMIVPAAIVFAFAGILGRGSGFGAVISVAACVIAGLLVFGTAFSKPSYNDPVYKSVRESHDRDKKEAHEAAYIENQERERRARERIRLWDTDPDLARRTTFAGYEYPDCQPNHK